MEKVKMLTLTEVSKALGKRQQAVRIGIQRGLLPFGIAIPPEKKGGKYNYLIPESRFRKWLEGQDLCLTEDKDLM